jgi:uncharacterized protein with PIN domain
MMLDEIALHCSRLAVHNSRTPLLYKGEDFAQTDVTSPVPPSDP